MAQPLSYDASKCVLQYLDANLRFNLYRRCPSLSTIDRLVPFHIQTLQVDPCCVTINDTAYKIGVIQIYNNGQTPVTVREVNSEGGVTHDVDQYGIRRGETIDGQRMIGIWERRKKEHETKRTILTGLPQTDKIRKRIEEMNLDIEKIELRILSYNLRKANFVVPFKQYLQCQIKSDRRDQRERLNYEEETVSEAMEYLIRKLFENKTTVLVTTLIVGTHWNGQAVASPLLPLAPGTLSVQNLKPTENFQKSIDSLQPIWKHKPLKSLEANYYRMPHSSYRNPVVTSSEQLIISGSTDIDVFFKFRGNKNIHLKRYVHTEGQIELFVYTFKNSDIEIGKCYSIGFDHKIRAQNFLDNFKELLSAEKGELEEIRNTTFPECVIIPIREDAELNIYCEATSIEDRKFCAQPFIGKMKIQTRGFAVNL